MTTLKQILTAKENGDDSGYKYQLAQVLAAAEKLEEAEREVAMWARYFRNGSDIITKLTGLEMWHHDPGTTWYNNANKDVSKKYDTRAAAIKALIDDAIEWL
jgi:hypothetical protein